LFLTINVVISLVYISLQISYTDPIINLRGIKRQLVDSPSPTVEMNYVGGLYDYVSAISFVLTWIPTVVLLRNYFLGLGTAKYVILVTIPIIFYFFPLLSDELGIFDNLRLQYGREFTFYYTLLFGAYKQVGGLLFSLVFWATSLKLARPNLRLQLQIASFGMALLFGSTVLYGLSYIFAPPFGIVTISFMGLSSYMLSIGIFLTIKNIAWDSNIRIMLYKVMRDQISLINNASFAERDRLLRKSVKQVLNKIEVHEDSNSKIKD
jgi:hypothetical protein